MGQDAVANIAQRCRSEFRIVIEADRNILRLGARIEAFEGIRVERLRGGLATVLATTGAQTPVQGPRHRGKEERQCGLGQVDFRHLRHADTAEAAHAENAVGNREQVFAVGGLVAADVHGHRLVAGSTRGEQMAGTHDDFARQRAQYAEDIVQ